LKLQAGNFSSVLTLALLFFFFFFVASQKNSYLCPQSLNALLKMKEDTDFRYTANRPSLHVLPVHVLPTRCDARPLLPHIQRFSI
jgi:hypothetical protein